MIGHGTTVGPDCFLVAQVGIAGSVNVGHHVTLAGQVGIAGHLTIGDESIVAAQAGVIGDVKPKSRLFGSPAFDMRKSAAEHDVVREISGDRRPNQAVGKISRRRTGSCPNRRRQQRKDRVLDIMAIVTLENLHKSYGDRVLFDGLSFAIEKGERVGLIGDNGQGKTTLFKAIEGELKVERGNVTIARGARVGHLEQDPTFDPTNNVMDEAELAFSDLHQISHDLRVLEHAMAEDQGEALDRTLKKYEVLQEKFEANGGYAWRHKLEATLLGVGLGPEYWEQQVPTLSGGQRSRLALAKLLINAPDLLLLDEPTNHLDLAAIDWLENWLLDFSGAVLIISHDRYLLDRLATRIVWLTRKQLNSYPGNYSSFVTQREVEELTQRRQYEEQQADIEKQKEFIRRFGAGQRSKEAKGREKRLNRFARQRCDSATGRGDAENKSANFHRSASRRPAAHRARSVEIVRRECSVERREARHRSR